MNSSRLEQLKDFLKNDPNDPFILYAIATEYRNEQPSKAREYYEALLKNHPDYLATYYHAALLFIEFNEPELAETTFKNGIALAQKQGNALSLRELQNAYNEFLFED